MFEVWAQGGVTVQQAMLQVTEAILQSIAKTAFAQAFMQLALGWAALSPISLDFGHAGEHFTSAALWFARGPITDVGSGLIANASNGNSSAATGGSGGSAAPTTTAASGVTQGQTSSQNTLHLAGGGLAFRPTLAIIGDSKNGGSAREAVLPLDNPAVMSEIAVAVMRAAVVSGSLSHIAPLVGAGDGTAGGSRMIHVENHWHIEGLISPDNMRKVATQAAREISRQVKHNGLELTASNSFRVTRKS